MRSEVNACYNLKIPTYLQASPPSPPQYTPTPTKPSQTKPPNPPPPTPPHKNNSSSHSFTHSPIHHPIPSLPFSITNTHTLPTCISRHHTTQPNPTQSTELAPHPTFTSSQIKKRNSEKQYQAGRDIYPHLLYLKNPKRSESINQMGNI